jgi:hypothetical protein
MSHLSSWEATIAPLHCVAAWSLAQKNIVKPRMKASARSTELISIKGSERSHRRVNFARHCNVGDKKKFSAPQKNFHFQKDDTMARPKTLAATHEEIRERK